MATSIVTMPLGTGAPSPAQMRVNYMHSFTICIHWHWVGSLQLAMAEVCTTKIGIYLELDTFSLPKRHY